MFAWWEEGRKQLSSESLEYTEAYEPAREPRRRKNVRDKSANE